MKIMVLHKIRKRHYLLNDFLEFANVTLILQLNILAAIVKIQYQHWDITTDYLILQLNILAVIVKIQYQHWDITTDYLILQFNISAVIVKIQYQHWDITTDYF